ncbi:cancer-related nucleoside-triphosphatase isoform X2 [Falco rusticolus]|uniref:cancer-related nucleoside-triphosphatase isoform X2 n=1 Tax=Falco rusticolus TaxID=120794 RepID=UPI0018865351|nr:cancer-related nucleoside-triphosphatase isoform X2 [Falco rusticolus]
MAKHVFLTGPPGVGKTTLIQKVTQALKSSGIPIDGFYTEEVREGGRRTGFDVVTLSGKRGPLSRVSSDSSTSRREYRVGQYVVDLVSFEHLVLPVLRNVSKETETAFCKTSWQLWNPAENEDLFLPVTLKPLFQQNITTFCGRFRVCPSSFSPWRLYWSLQGKQGVLAFGHDSSSGSALSQKRGK